MKTYKVQHILFDLRWFLNLLKLGPKNLFLLTRRRLIDQLKLSYGDSITQNYFLIYFRFLRKSKKYKKLVYFANNQDHQNVIRIFKTMPSATLDAHSLKHARNAYRHFNQNSKAREIQRLITDNYFEKFPKIEESNFINAIESGGSQVGTLHELKDGSIKNIIKVKNFEQHPIKNSTEKQFYLSFSNDGVGRFIPAFKSFTTNENLGFLKLEYIHGRKPILNDMQQILELQKELFKIKYFELISIKSLTQILVYIINKPNSLPYFSKNKMEQQISKLSNYCSLKTINGKSHEHATVLKEIFLNPPIYYLINLKQDLVLQHGDFGYHNIIVNTKGVPIVYDWNDYQLGLPGSDILQFILQFTLDFDYIRTHLFDFLEKEKINNFHVVSSYLVLIYLNHLMNQPEGIRTQENLHKAMEYLTMSPLNS